MADLVLTPYSVLAIRALNVAVVVARGAGAFALSTEHLLVALLNQRDGNARLLLEHHFGVNPTDIRAAVEPLVNTVRHVQAGPTTLVADDGGRFPLSPTAAAVLDRARALAAGLRRTWAGTDHLLAALIDVDSPAGSVLRRFGVDPPGMRQALELVGQPLSGRDAEAGAAAAPGAAVDLVRASRAGDWSPVFEREAPLSRLLTSLAHAGGRSVLLVGEPGVGKRSLAHALAQSLSRSSPGSTDGAGEASPTVPGSASVTAGVAAWLPGEVWALRPAALLEGAEAALGAAVDLARGGVLLVPDLHLYFGANTAPGVEAAGALLRRALLAGAPRLIGTTTPAMLARWFEPDPSLMDRLTVLRVEPASVDEAIAILDLRRPALESDYGLRVAPDAPRAAASLAKTYLPQALPAAAVALIENACALVRTAAVESLSPKQPGVAADGVVDAADVALAVSHQTGVPVGQLLGPERDRLARMEEVLHERVVGQEEAIRAVANAVRRARAGLKDPKRPIGSFLFLGPTGVGKTEVARALAEFLFGSEEALIQIDMSEYMERHAVARLVGAPPGYVGYEAGGQLTERVRQRPYAVVLFDEVEKAHPDVFNLFLQLLEEGWLTDGQGRRVDFRNTVIILTSNLGTEYILQEARDRQLAGVETDEADRLSDAIREDVMAALSGRFRPEFLNRLDGVVVFTPLGPVALRQILGLFIRGVEKQLAAGPGVSLDVTDHARDWLLAQYHEPEYGARPLRRLVDRYLRDELGSRLISGDVQPGQRVRVDVEGERLSFAPA